jgi:hypothetical protein
MDDIVKQALAKWPNVPHCYGWLSLDARGNWRMRERAQQLGLAGDKLNHSALLGFIVRNYAHDGRGCWYFQNGPQRVYLNLEATPYIVRTDPAQGWLLHTAAPMETITEAALTEAGELVLVAGDVVAQLDDRDFALVLPLLRMDGEPVADEALLAWLEGATDGMDAGSTAERVLTLEDRGRAIPVHRVARAGLAERYGFVRVPAA